MKHTKKWTLIYATGWLVIGIGLIAVSGYQWIALGQAIVSVGYAIGGGCCIVPAMIMFLKWRREEEIELEAYGRQFDEEVAKRQGQIRIDLNAEKEELKKRLALTEKALKLACLSLRGKCDYCKYKDNEICPPDHHCSNLVMEYFLEQAKGDDEK